MSTVPGAYAPLRRTVLASIPVLALTWIVSAASAQTAPSLLPYTAKLLAGGGAAISAGATCPVSGFTATDKYGDGCLATEINIATNGTGTGPRYAIADKTGAVFFSDATNGLVRRIDPITGVVTAVAGGAASNPSSGATCGTLTSTDVNGDGCLGTAVKLSHPMGLAFDASGNLYFADNGFDEVRKIAATVGLISTTGVISNVAGNLTTYGYNVNNTASSPVNAATQSYLNFPYGIAFDAAGNLYIDDEGNNALEVVNLTGTSESIQGMTVAVGTIAKFAGYGNLASKSANSGDCPDFVSTSARGGCYFGNFSNGANANTSNVDSAYSLTVDPSGNVYFANEFNNNVGLITSANVISTYAGIQGTALKKNQRGAAGSFAIGSVFGVAADSAANLYVTDASSGFIWRVDGTPGHTMYVVAGGATTPCAAAIDAYGDGCTGLTAKLGSSGTGNFASTTAPGPGVFGVNVDAYSDLFFGDTETGLIREIASGTQFGNVGASQTDAIEIHFAANDGPAASGAYTITAGSSIFSVALLSSCTVNSDTTQDCVLSVTAAPSTLGPFTGALQVNSKLGGVATFPLSGNFVQSPITRTVVSATSTTAGCTGSTFSTATAATLTATLVANGPSAPTGTIVFSVNGTPIAPTSGVAVTNLGTPNNPVYGATLSYTFASAGTYSVTSTYSGNGYFHTSTSTAPASVTAATPAFTTQVTAYQSNAVSAGQTALYSFNIIQTVYTGSITFSCSGLPANSSCVFTTNSVAGAGCSTTTTVGLSIVTQRSGTILASAFGSGRGPWAILSLIATLGLALLVGLGARRTHLGRLWIVLALLAAASGLAACNGVPIKTAPATPTGSYNVTVTATGSAGGASSFTVPLTVQ